MKFCTKVRSMEGLEERKNRWKGSGKCCKTEKLVTWVLQMVNIHGLITGQIVPLQRRDSIGQLQTLNGVQRLDGER